MTPISVITHIYLLLKRQSLLSKVYKITGSCKTTSGKHIYVTKQGMMTFQVEFLTQNNTASALLKINLNIKLQ